MRTNLTCTLLLGAVFMTTLSAAPSAVGPWGILEVDSYELVPPASIASRLELVDTGEWVLSLPSWRPFDDFLERLPMSASTRAALRDPSARRIRADDGTLRLRVPDEVRRNLPPATRGELYRWLGAFPRNTLHMLPYVLPSNEVIERAGLNPMMRQTLSDLIFTRGARRCLVDADLVAALATDDGERIRLKQLLYRTVTLSMELRRESLANREDVVRYWGRPDSGRIQSLLRRFEQSPELESVDVLQLLPAGVRRILNSYPDNVLSPASANCMWLSLNFFEPGLSTRFLPDIERGDTTEIDARAELSERYESVNGPYRFGDVLALWAETPHANALVHLVVYIADDIVLTKNGIGYATPFVLAPLDDVTRRYAWIGQLTLRTYRLRAD